MKFFFENLLLAPISKGSDPTLSLIFVLWPYDAITRNRIETLHPLSSKSLLSRPK